MDQFLQFVRLGRSGDRGHHHFGAKFLSAHLLLALSHQSSPSPRRSMACWRGAMHSLLARLSGALPLQDETTSMSADIPTADAMALEGIQ